MRYILFSILLLPLSIAAQVEYREYSTIIDGQSVIVLVKEGDTVIIADLEKAVVTAPVEFDYTEDRDKYMKYRRYAAVVYPYAVQAIRLYRQLETETKDKSERERKKIVKSLSKRLEDEFEDPLKNLTRTQGLILTKMIERHLDRSFFDVVKELKGGFSAFYWNQLSKRFGYDLKDEYREGADPVMDAVLEDFDIKKDL
jgi:hypothetical protein